MQPALALAASPSSAQVFTRTLVRLTRTIWGANCSFVEAMGAICEASAEALGVERVSIWEFERDENLLRCIHIWDATAKKHSSGEEHESMIVDPQRYMATLQKERSVVGVREDSEATALRDSSPFPDYVRRFRMHSVMDAPACADGELQGAICHESTHDVRQWSHEELTFAGSMGDFVAMAYEVDRRRRAETRVEHLRVHDDATGLPNRTFFVERLRQRLGMAQKANELVTVLVLSVDCSSVSSTPHAPNPEDVVVRIARELQRLGGLAVEVARVHSSKFAFLLSRGEGHGAAIRLAERGLARMASVEWEQAENAPSGGVGIAFSDATRSTDAGELLRQAEEAAHRALATTKPGYEIYEAAHHEALVTRLRTVRALREAMANDDFEVQYQPEFDTRIQQWVAAEALIRWNDAGTLRPASEFVEIAEEAGLMVPLGHWVLRRACRDAATWPLAADGSPVNLRVNVSALQFDDDKLLDEVALALGESGLAPARLCLEITETTLMANFEHAPKVMDRLHSMGVKLAIDDFGTGYASLIYLKHFSVDVLKIDRAFVRDLPENPVDAAIVSALVGLASRLSIEVVAEGVETPEQQAALSMLGIGRQQGWLYAMAMSQADWTTRLASAHAEASQ